MGIKNFIGLFIFAIIVAIIPKIQSKEYYLHIYTNIGINCIIVVGLSLFMGYAGQISLGQAGFFAIGAYTTGLLTTKLGFNPLTTIAIGMLISAIVAMLIGIPSLRLRGHYLAMATLGFGFIVYILFKGAIATSGGVEGVRRIPKLIVFGFEFQKQIPKFYLTWGTVILLVILGLNVMNSRIGRACRAIHGNETAASSMGIDAALLKIQMFMISATFAAVAGSYMAVFDGYISPEQFSIDRSIHLVILVAIGGMTNLWTSLAGAVFLSLLFTYLNDNWDFFKDYKILFDGAILMVIMMFFPKGLFISIGEKIKRLRSMKIFGKKSVGEVVAK